jgi:hypothetical protein
VDDMRYVFRQEKGYRSIKHLLLIVDRGHTHVQTPP